MLFLGVNCAVFQVAGRKREARVVVQETSMTMAGKLEGSFAVFTKRGLAD